MSDLSKSPALAVCEAVEAESERIRTGGVPDNVNDAVTMLEMAARKALDRRGRGPFLLLDIRCQRPQCGRLLLKAAPGSVVQTKCVKCGHMNDRVV